MAFVRSKEPLFAKVRILRCEDKRLGVHSRPPRSMFDVANVFLSVFPFEKIEAQLLRFLQVGLWKTMCCAKFTGGG